MKALETSERLITFRTGTNPGCSRTPVPAVEVMGVSKATVGPRTPGVCLLFLGLTGANSPPRRRESDLLSAWGAEGHGGGAQAPPGPDSDPSSRGVGRVGGQNKLASWGEWVPVRWRARRGWCGAHLRGRAGLPPAYARPPRVASAWLQQWTPGFFSNSPLSPCLCLQRRWGRPQLPCYPHPAQGCTPLCVVFTPWGQPPRSRPTGFQSPCFSP